MSLFNQKNAILDNKESKLKKNKITCPYCQQKIARINNDVYRCNLCNKNISFSKTKLLYKNMNNFDNMFSNFNKIRGINTKKKVDIHENKCNHCGENEMIVDKGKYVCGQCGREYGNFLSKKQEWRFSLYDKNNENKSRCTIVKNPLLPTLSYRVSQPNSNRVRIHSSVPSKERALAQAISKMKKCGKKLGIKGALVDKAVYIYSMVANNVTKGVGKQGVMAACQFMACKDDKNTNICCRETICHKYGISSKLFNEGKKELEECIYSVPDKKNKDFKKLQKIYINPSDPENIVRKVCNQLRLKNIDSACIIYICKKVKEYNLSSSKMPHSIASGCILLYLQYKSEQNSTEEKIDINKISNMCSVSRNTAENTAFEFKEYIPYIFPRNKDDIKNCMPHKNISKKYEISLSTPEIIIRENKPVILKRSRGRPRKNKVSTNHT